MAPRKSERQATAPTRRSGRIASRASSRASSVADDNDSGLYLPTPSPAPCSLAPSSLSPSRVIDAVDSVQSAGKSVISSNTRITRSQSKKGGVTLYNTGVTKKISQKEKPAAVPVPSRRAVAPVSTTRRLPFNADYAVGCILSEIQSNPGSRIKYLDSLTMAEKDAVIQRLGEHVVEFKEKLSDAEIRADQMAAERDAAVEERNRARMRLQTPMRDAMLQQSLRRRREESVTSIETPSHSHTPAAAPAQTPAAASDTPFTSKSLDFSTQDLITGTPVQSSADKPTHSPDPYATPKPRSSTSIVGSFFKAIASPFLSRRKSQESSTPPQQTPKEKLGELPASRKRSAPAQQEPDTYTQPQVQSQAQIPISSTPRQQELASERSATYTTPRASTTSSTQQTARAFLMPSSKNPRQETSLATITEHTEMSEQSMAVDPTPVRAPRTIAAVRRQQTPSRYSHTPQRIWSQTPQPKDTNADRRLEKLRKFKELDAQLKELQQDEEVKQMTERPLKRVKVDTLVKIPHNRPGEASGTFRMPDIDSDDEMEVDADQETRSNIFDVSAEEETAVTPKATPAAPAPIAHAPAVTAAPPPPPAPAAPPAPLFSFPDVGRLEGGATNDVTNAYLGAKFAYGFEHWKETGELLDLF
ncbi:hypothetical protein CBER1_04023 [Cercospora berteroae]|uniref:Uncharacterized protein n=1 Tax=Cercospora berteroae TaxID=357750 RepID=A0A2S6C4V8_9PEZI|nr:hypothetical protein CBER1_04023 [Cercospora berteroae]